WRERRDNPADYIRNRPGVPQRPTRATVPGRTLHEDKKQPKKNPSGAGNGPSVTALLKSLEASSCGMVSHNKVGAFTTVEVAHVFAVSLLLGTIMIVDLRLLGLASAKRPFTDVARRVLPFTWAAFVLAVGAGSLLFISRATEYVASPVFWTQMALIVLAGIHIALFGVQHIR